MLHRRLFPVIARRVLYPLVSILLILALGVYLLQERMIFVPEKLNAEYRFRFREPHDEKWLESQGLKLHSLLFTTASPKGVILYFHGNAGSLGGWGEVAGELTAKTGWDTWILDYPGYGKSEGKITGEAQLHAAADALWAEARKLYPKVPITIYGRSIGTGIAVHLAMTHEASALVLETPFLNLPALARQLAPWAPGFLLKYKFPSDDWIRAVKCPILVVHGTGDELIPFEQGRELASETKLAKFVEIPGGTHNELAESPKYWEALGAFLSAR